MPIAQATLRQLMTAHYPTGHYLLAAVQALAAVAQVDFVMPRQHMYEVYRDRLGLSRAVTGHWFEGLEETVAALHRSPLAEVRLLQASTEPGSCLVFTDPDLREVVGIIYFAAEA
jgi:hypothetical protein